jgi:hypothetical protein
MSTGAIKVSTTTKPRGRGRPFAPGNKYGRLEKGNTLAVKHSLHRFRRLLEGPKLDGRTALYTALREREQELAISLGGDPSPQERIIIADAIKTLLYVGTLDEYLMKLDGNIVRNHKVISVVDTRIKLASHLRESLKAIGLKRQAKQVTLTEILQQPEQPEPPKESE